MLTQADIDYIIANEGADVTRLLLGAKGKKGDVNYPLCAKCIQAREKMKMKAPLWYANAALVYPFSVSVEQGSSQATALFKQECIKTLFAENLSGRKINTADLTGGMGIDSYFISQIASTHYYFERNAELCAATEYNLRQLGANNIIVSNRDITADNCAVLRELQGKDISLIYIDPARRTQTGGKAIMLQDYEPNIIELQELLFAASRYVLVKVSPMADIKQNLQLLPKTSAVYVVAVNNECKELLFLLDRQHTSPQEPPIFCCNVDILSNTLINNDLKNNTYKECKTKHPDYQLIVQNIVVKIQEEEQAQAHYTSTVGKYLYEPGKAVLKGGAYKLLSQRYNCNKLAVSTHLYTADNIIEQFPGKTFIVEECIPFNKKALKEIAARYPNADITARNFPLDTNALKKLSGIKDGGCKHIFAVTLTNGDKVIILTQPLLK